MLSSSGQKGSGKFPSHRTAGPVSEQVDVGPIPHQSGVAVLKDLPAILFRISGFASGRNGSQPAFAHIERFDAFGIVDRYRSIGFYHRSASATVNPFQCIHDKSFLSPLPQIAEKIGITGRAFSFLDSPR